MSIQSLGSELASTQSAVIERLLQRSQNATLANRGCLEMRAVLRGISQTPDYAEPECKNIVDYYTALIERVRRLAQAKQSAVPAQSARIDALLKRLNAKEVLEMSDIDATNALLREIDELLISSKRSFLPSVRRPAFSGSRSAPSRPLAVAQELDEERKRDLDAEELLQLDQERFDLMQEGITDLQGNLSEYDVGDSFQVSAQEWDRIQDSLKASTEAIASYRAEIARLKTEYRRCVYGGADDALIDRFLQLKPKLDQLETLVNTLQQRYP